MSALSGIFVPNIIPYDAKGRINEDELRRIIRWLGDKGVTGFYPNGSMGEFIRLSYEERRRVIEIVAAESGGRPILGGAAEPNVDVCLDADGPAILELYEDVITRGFARLVNRVGLMSTEVVPPRGGESV